MNRLAHFEQLYTASPDPWHVHASAYEARKAGLAVAMLPRARYALAFEPGCGAGALSRRLAARCDRVLATDFSPMAVNAARAHLQDLPGVEVRQLELPRQWPADGGIDLVVFSELLYYLDPEALAQVLGRCQAMRAHSDILCVHARADFGDRTLDAAALQAALHAALGAPHASYREDAYCIELWAAPALPAPGGRA